jgi:Reverse transcriptase (RNA-dependent DNA polymerase)
MQAFFRSKHPHSRYSRRLGNRVKSAYLYGKLSKDEIIYMKPPPHYTLKDICPGQVLRLNSTIYGLKQSGRRWYEVLCAILESFEMIRLETDHAVFYHQESDGSMTILFVHVDDMTLIARNIVLMNRNRKSLAELPWMTMDHCTGFLE